MAGISICDKLPETERLRLVSAIAEGMSWSQISSTFNIPSTTIRDWASANGYARSAVPAKRRVFDDLLSRSTADIAEDPAAPITTGNAMIDLAASANAKAGKLASDVALSVIKRLAYFLSDVDSSGNRKPPDELPDLKDCQSITYALEKAWNTYSRIHKLDNEVQDKVVIHWDGIE